MDQFIRFRDDRDRLYGHADLAPRAVSASRTVISVMMEIEHANIAGYVHGGTIMRLVDTAAGIAAARHAGRRVVTAAMDDMSFLSPVYIGDLVTALAMVNDSHRTSMEVGVRVDVETVPSGQTRRVATAHLVFVGLDEAGKPTPVPPVIAETDDEKRRQAQARVRREQRLIRKRALEQAVQERP
ncbi:MAG TPA: hotdog domain-containing protein [Candidatus Dormibacteraeota bacterium]|nr:hotdog domain-containing protein [Candidatus Dormibacteraeota bacterium]